MPTLKAVVVLELDGVPLPGFPFSRRMTLTKTQAFDYTKAASEGATVVPLNQITAAVNALVLKPSTLATVVLGKLVLNGGGLLLVIDGDLGTGAQATIANGAASTQEVAGMGGGS